MRNTGKQPRYGRIPEPLMQILIKEKMRGEEDWMHPERARFEIEFRYAQQRMKAWNAANRDSIPTVERDGFEAVWNYRTPYPAYMQLPEYTGFPSTRRKHFVSQRYMDIWIELIRENPDDRDAFSKAFRQCEAEADKLGLEHRSW